MRKFKEVSIDELKLAIQQNNTYAKVLHSVQCYDNTAINVKNILKNGKLERNQVLRELMIQLLQLNCI